MHIRTLISQSGLWDLWIFCFCRHQSHRLRSGETLHTHQTESNVPRIPRPQWTNQAAAHYSFAFVKERKRKGGKKEKKWILTVGLPASALQLSSHPMYRVGERVFGLTCYQRESLHHVCAPFPRLTWCFSGSLLCWIFFLAGCWVKCVFMGKGQTASLEIIIMTIRSFGCKMQLGKAETTQATAQLTHCACLRGVNRGVSVRWLRGHSLVDI